MIPADVQNAGKQCIDLTLWVGSRQLCQHARQAALVLLHHDAQRVALQLGEEQSTANSSTNQSI